VTNLHKLTSHNTRLSCPTTRRWYRNDRLLWRMHSCDGTFWPRERGASDGRNREYSDDDEEPSWTRHLHWQQTSK